MFRRPRGLHRLPRPCWDGSIELLKKYTNAADADFPLLVAWMTAALRPMGPYPNWKMGSEGVEPLACRLTCLWQRFYRPP